MGVNALEGLWGMLLVSAALRVALLLYGEWQDAHMEVRYTDGDYLVFSDAAALVAAGRSPFERSTYRYSPLLAFLLIPNSLVHRCCGKVLFSAADLLVGLFINAILLKRGVSVTLRHRSVAIWLFNPFTFTIGTRGNCEPLVCAMVLWVIISLMNGKLLQAALWYGVVVHFRVYPIIYSLPLLLILDDHNIRLGQKHVELYGYSQMINDQHSYDKVAGSPVRWQQIIVKQPFRFVKSLFSWERVIFGLLSGSVFLFLTALFFHLYGWEFLHEALLYHLTRLDPRHNFSIYFYHIYLHHQSKFSVVEKLAAFLPQLMVQLVLVFRFAQDLPFCFFVQTVAFVAFNKVITAQYFVWFFCLLPLILPWSGMKMKGLGLVCVTVWMVAQVHWLMWAYLLEFRGRNVFIQLWLSSIMFLAANTFVLMNIISHHTFAPLFVPMHSQSAVEARKND